MHPLVFAALCFMGGIAAGDFLQISLSFSLFAAAGFLIFSSAFFLLKKHLVSFAFLLTVIFFIGAATLKYSDKASGGSFPGGMVDYYGKTAYVKGVVSESPSFSSFKLSSDEISILGARVGGEATVMVLNKTDFRGYDYGDCLAVRGVVTEPFRSRSGGDMLISVYSPLWIENLGSGKINPPVDFAILAGKKMEDVIDKTMPEPESLFLKSVLLGKRHLLPPEIRNTLTEAGAGHFLSVSGLHAGLVLLVLLAAASAAGLSQKQTAAVSIAGLVLFCLMTGARVPTVRAVLLASVVLSGRFFSRQVNSWNALALGALAILAFKPRELFAAGFQLSFVAVAGIFYLYPALSGLWPKAGKLSFLKKAVFALASIHLASSPLIGLYFGYVPVLSPAANLLLIPLLSVVVALGLSAGVLGAAFIFPAQIINAANWALIRGVLFIAGIFQRLTGFVYFDGFPGYLFILYYAALLALPLTINKLLKPGKALSYAE